MNLKLKIEIQHDDSGDDNRMKIEFSCDEGGLSANNIPKVRAAINACLDRMASKLPGAPDVLSPSQN